MDINLNIGVAFSGRVALEILKPGPVSDGQIEYLSNLVETGMSEISEKIASVAASAADVNASLDAAVSRVAEDVANIRANINTGATPEDLAALDALQATLSDLKNKLTALDPDPEFPPKSPTTLPA